MNWLRGLVIGCVGTALGVAGALTLADKPAEAQSMAMGPVHVAASTTGNASHAWAIDPRTSLVIHCVSQGTNSAFDCKSSPLPGMARP